MTPRRSTRAWRASPRQRSGGRASRFLQALLSAALLSGVARDLGAQDTLAVARNDSVSLRLVDVDLRAAVQALARHLDRPVVFGAVSAGRVTLETPRPVPRREIPALLRGLVESQNLELALDTAANIYRVRPKDTSRPQPVVAAERSAAGQDGPTELFVIRLRHADAADVAATVNALYGRAAALGELGSRGGSGAGSSLSDDLRRTQVPPQDPNAPRIAPPAIPGAVAAVAGRVAALSGEVTIVPDRGTNRLLVRASRGDYELIAAAVRELDIRPLQVLIEVLIAEVRRDRSFSLGLDVEVPDSKVRGSTNTTVGASTSGGASGPIGLGEFALRVMNIGSIDIDATLRAATARGDARIVSRPVVLALNNEEAEILVGSQRPFVQVQRSLPTDAPSRDQVVQYRDVGTRLIVKPTISDDGYVTLRVTQEVNAATGESQFDAPVISTRTVETRLLVRDSQTVVLGGLSDRQRERRNSGVPLLSTLPLIGALFGRETRNTTETEFFLFLTPRIIRTDAEADRATKPMEDRARKAGP